MSYEVNDQYIRLAKLIANLMQAQFYGELEIKFKDGKVVACHKAESLIV